MPLISSASSVAYLHGIVSLSFDDNCNLIAHTSWPSSSTCYSCIQLEKKKTQPAPSYVSTCPLGKKVIIFSREIFSLRKYSTGTTHFSLLSLIARLEVCFPVTAQLRLPSRLEVSLSSLPRLHSACCAGRSAQCVSSSLETDECLHCFNLMSPFHALCPSKEFGAFPSNARSDLRKALRGQLNTLLSVSQSKRAPR